MACWRYGVAVFVALVSGVLSSRAALDRDALVGLWLFDEGKGDVAKDTSGKHNDAKLMKEPKWVDGKFGKALEFAFTANNYAIAPLPQSADLTLVVWAKASDYPTANSGVAHVQADENPDGAPESKTVGIWVENTSLLWGRFIPQGGGNVNLPKNQKIEKNRWYHLAMTLSAGDKKGKQWVDGVVVGEADYPGKLNAFAFVKIGRQGTESWTGVLDEFAVFAKALSADDIKALMGGLEAGLPVSPTGKVAQTWAELKTR
jgi:hypothetical protein